MHFEPEHIYHVYNRGNNKATIFFNNENYLFFLRKVKKEWMEYCDIFCYCLMPNHFHFMIKPTTKGCEHILLKNQPSHLQLLSKTIGKTLRSYTKAINVQNNSTGNLFQKKTKAKDLTEINFQASPYTLKDYLINCFWYIHNNPLEAGIVESLNKWAYSSWPDYYGFRNGNLCNKAAAMERIGLAELDLIPERKIHIDEKIQKEIW